MATSAARSILPDRWQATTLQRFSLTGPGAAVLNTEIAIATVWTLSAASFVYLMHGGFGFFEAGMTRRRNTVATLTHNLMVLAFTAVVYWAVGFGLMYGKGSLWFGTQGFFPGLTAASIGDFPSLASKPVPLVVAFAFALAFADTPATLVAGAAAERLKLSGFMVLTALIGGLIFPLVGRATFADGVLQHLRVPFYDSGAAAVQLCGGLCAWVACWRIGPRQGRFAGRADTEAEDKEFPPSSMPLVFLGIFILWMGFIGFNAGLSMTVTPAIGLIIVNTVLGSMAGSAVALLSVWALRGKGSLRAALIGMLTAAVAVTSISPIVEPWAAVVTGVFAGALAPPCMKLVARMKLDDPVEYLTMNVFGGVVGTLAVGIFASPEVARGFRSGPLPQPGLWYGHAAQLWAQVEGMVAIAAFTLPLMFVAVFVLQRLDMFRVPAVEEQEGSDHATHGEDGYMGFAWASEVVEDERAKRKA